MAHDGPCFAEDLLNELVPLLLREEAIGADALLGLAERLQRRADHASIDDAENLSDMAHQLRVWVLQADAPEPSQQKAERRRAKLRIVPPSV